MMMSFFIITEKKNPNEQKTHVFFFFEFSGRGVIIVVEITERLLVGAGNVHARAHVLAQFTRERVCDSVIAITSVSAKS